MAKPGKMSVPKKCTRVRRHTGDGNNAHRGPRTVGV